MILSTGIVVTNRVGHTSKSILDKFTIKHVKILLTNLIPVDHVVRHLKRSWTRMGRMGFKYGFEGPWPVGSGHVHQPFLLHGTM